MEPEHGVIVGLRLSQAGRVAGGLRPHRAPARACTAQRENALEPRSGLRQGVLSIPERVQRDAQTLSPLRLFTADDIVEGGAEVLLLDFAARQPLALLHNPDRRISLFCHHEAVRRVHPS